MEITEHGLKKPAGDDFYNVEDFNANTQVLEDHLSDKNSHVSAEEIANIEIPDALTEIDNTDTNETIWGKVKKLISEFLLHIKLMASSTAAGHVKVTTGNGLKNSSGAVSMDTGTASAYGTVKLSDSYTASGGDAAAGVGASSKAVYEAYNELNTNLINKIAIDDVEVSTIAGQDYVYYPVRQGYTLFNAYTNEYNGTAVEKIAYAGSSSTYIIFFDVAPSTNGKIPLKFIWVKN